MVRRTNEADLHRLGLSMRRDIYKSETLYLLVDDSVSFLTVRVVKSRLERFIIAIHSEHTSYRAWGGSLLPPLIDVIKIRCMVVPFICPWYLVDGSSPRRKGRKRTCGGEGISINLVSYLCQ